MKDQVSIIQSNEIRLKTTSEVIQELRQKVQSGSRCLHQIWQYNGEREQCCICQVDGTFIDGEFEPDE
jgi:hypothetical protein